MLQILGLCSGSAKTWAQSSRMLATVQPSRAATSVMGSGSVNDSAEPRLAELALLVVVVDEEGQGGAVGCRGVLEHLQVPSRVAGGEDRAPAQLGLNSNWAGRVLLSTVLVGGTRGEGAAGKAPPEPADRLRWRLLTGWPRH